MASGVNHIDTSDFYGPHVTNQIIREALHPYPDGLVIVTKLGAVRGADASWKPAQSPAELIAGVHDNLSNLRPRRARRRQPPRDGRRPRAERGVDRGASSTALADLQRQGLIRHVGPQQRDGRPGRPKRTRSRQIVCVQNHYNLAHREDDALIDDLARQGIPYVPFFPLGGFTPLQSSTLSDVAARLGATPMQVALAWLLHRSPNILLIPGTSSRGHLRENLAAAELTLPARRPGGAGRYWEKPRRLPSSASTPPVLRMGRGPGLTAARSRPPVAAAAATT